MNKTSSNNKYVTYLIFLFQAEDSLSLLDLEKNGIDKPSCSNSCEDGKSLRTAQGSETSSEIDLLKSKLALLSEQMKKIEESKLDLLKNYEVVCEKNFVLDQQLAEVCVIFSSFLLPISLLHLCLYRVFLI